MTPKSSIVSRVSQSPNLRADFWIRKSPTPQNSIAAKAAMIPIDSIETPMDHTCYCVVLVGRVAWLVMTDPALLVLKEHS